VVTEAVVIMSERDVACEVVLEILEGMHEASVESSSLLLELGKNLEEFLWKRDEWSASSC
jgi:hypothetical protein